MFVKKLLFSFYQEADMSFFLEFQSSLLKAWMKFWKFLQHVLADEKFLSQLKHNSLFINWILFLDGEFSDT